MKMNKKAMAWEVYVIEPRRSSFTDEQISYAHVHARLVNVSVEEGVLRVREPYSLQVKLTSQFDSKNNQMSGYAFRVETSFRTGSDAKQVRNLLRNVDEVKESDFYAFLSGIANDTGIKQIVTGHGDEKAISGLGERTNGMINQMIEDQIFKKFKAVG